MMNNQPSEKKQINYKKSFCAFLDILGFQSLVNSNEGKSKLEHYFWLVNSRRDYLKGIQDKTDIKILGVSDSIIMSYELVDDFEKDIDRFRHFLLAIALIQSSFATHNIWLRGGVSIGDVAFEPDESFIVGRGYIQAYKLEQVAKYPRVILDTNVVKELGLSSFQELIQNINNKSVISGFSNWKGDIIYDWYNNVQMNTPLVQDVPLFIDYLAFTIQKEQDALDIVNHLKINFLSSVDHFEKYQWVARYIKNKIDKRNFSSQGELEPELKEIYDMISKEISGLGIR